MPMTAASSWPIDPACRARTHNTIRAATRTEDGARCECARGRVRRKRHTAPTPARQRDAERAAGAAMVLKPRARSGNVFARERLEIPNLAGGACQTDFGRRLVDERDARGHTGEVPRQAAKLICQ